MTTEALELALRLAMVERDLIRPSRLVVRPQMEMIRADISPGMSQHAVAEWPSTRREGLTDSSFSVLPDTAQNEVQSFLLALAYNALAVPYVSL